MNANAIIYAGWLLAGLIFGAGVAWAKFLRLHRDLNGLGRGYRRDRWNFMLAVMAMTEKREDRELLANFLRDS